MSLVLNVEILGEFKKLTEATTGSQKSLGNLEDSAKKISSGINKTLGLIGVGFSLNFLVDQFKASTEAAIEDNKSKVILNKTLKENLNISEEQADAIDKYITKTQFATSITDDQLRPAFQKLALSTGNVNRAMDLLAVAADVAAGTGKDVTTVAQAMARALEGNETALFRLVPSLKNAKDPLAELAETFKGAAEEAALTDPYERMQIIFGEMQEKIGEELLPILEDFSTWLATPEGQEKLEDLVDGITGLIDTFTEMTDYVFEELIPVLEDLTGEKGFGALITAAGTLTVGMGLLKTSMMFLSAGNPVLAGIIAGIALVSAAYGALGSSIDEVLDKQNQFKSATPGQPSGSVPLGPGSPVSAAGGKIGIVGRNAPTTPQRVPVDVPGKPGSVKVDIKATIDANSVVKQINDKLKSQGSNLRLK